MGSSLSVRKAYLQFRRKTRNADEVEFMPAWRSVRKILLGARAKRKADIAALGQPTAMSAPEASSSSFTRAISESFFMYRNVIRGSL